MLNLNIRTATGVRAMAAPANSPARWASIPSPVAGAAARRTARWSSQTVPTPMSASGTRMLHGLRPNSRTESPVTQSAAGGLSTVMELAASEDPKNQAVQSCDPAWAAAE